MSANHRIRATPSRRIGHALHLSQTKVESAIWKLKMPTDHSSVKHMVSQQGPHAEGRDPREHAAAAPAGHKPHASLLGPPSLRAVRFVARCRVLALKGGLRHDGGSEV